MKWKPKKKKSRYSLIILNLILWVVLKVNELQHFKILSFPGGSDGKKKNPPAMQEIQVQSLGQEDTLEKEMAAYCSIFAWRTPQPEEPGWLLSIGSQRVDTTEPIMLTNKPKSLATMYHVTYYFIKNWIHCLQQNMCFLALKFMQYLFQALTQSWIHVRPLGKHLHQ